MLARLLWQLSEAGEPAVLLGTGGTEDERQEIDRLVRQGVLLVRPRATGWDPCRGCQCGADERRPSWEGDTALAKCAIDRGRDERFQADEVATFTLVIPSFMQEVSAALGLSSAQEIANGVWSLGQLSDERLIIAAPTRAAISHPQLIGSLRLSHREGPIVLVGPTLPIRARGMLAAQGVHHVVPADAVPEAPGGPLLALDLSRLPSGRNGDHALVLRSATCGVRFMGRDTSIRRMPFKLLEQLALAHRKGKPLVHTGVLHQKLYSTAARPNAVRQLVSELRQQLRQKFGASAEVDALIENRTGQGYALALPPLSVMVT